MNGYTINWPILLLAVGGGFAILVFFIMLSLRVVAPTNAIHIVQSGKKTVSYGKDQPAGNVYYRWPSWIPVIGRMVSKLPVNVMTITLEDYAAYDKGRVPFLIDIMAFFRITDSNVAAQRITTMQELDAQLKGILQGVCRTILATSEIEEILEGRAKFGEMFTKEVDGNLVQWGLQSVKQIELMDIRDANGSQVIANIMAKKKSHIEMESRVTVANNLQAAQVAEVTAQQTVAIRQQEATEAVAVRTAARNKAQGVADQEAAQAVKEQERMTATKQMAVIEVQNVRKAEIDRASNLVVADQQRQVAVIDADAQKQKTVVIATGNLEASKLNAEGVRVKGVAEGAAETAILMAPVTAQITLAEKIGSDTGYQTYLVNIRTIEKDQAVGVAQATALQKAEIKVIANTGDVTNGVTKAMDLLSSKGGTSLGAMVEAFKQTPAGSAIMDKINGGTHA